MNSVILWGPSATGKTALLAQVYLRALAAENDWMVFVTEQSLPLVQRESEKFEKQNIFPLGTQAAAPEEITFDFKHRRSGEEFRLHTIDRAGKMSEDLEPPIRESLRDAAAMMLMIDSRRGAFESEVKDALVRLHLDRGLGTSKDPRPVAICLTKADQMIDSAESYRMALEEPEEFARPKLEEELLRWIDQHYANFRLFPVSAVGLRMSYGRIQRSIFYDEDFQLRVARVGIPIHHLTPFAWVFEQLKSDS